MNLTNLFGTVTAILSILTGIMTQLLGCATDAAGVTVCTSTLLPAKYMMIASGVFGVLVVISKLLRPGGALHSLFGPTAVVVDKPGVGTVTPAQVKTP